uniref:Uncharacterized protein n=1 Tax=Arundo donax TaxID=35708 RepID=A0A0A9EV14_ARUDO
MSCITSPKYDLSIIRITLSELLHECLIVQGR